MACKNNRLVMKIKSGEEKGFNFTIKANAGFNDVNGNPVYNPVDLSDYVVEFQIKKYPYYSVQSIIEKIITLDEQEGIGWINNPTNGNFVVQITLEDLEKLVPEKDYYLIITLVTKDNRIIISGENDKSGIFRVCQS